MRYLPLIITLCILASIAGLTARRVLSVYDTAARECLRMEASGSAAMIGFLGATAVVRPTSTTDLRTALINLGLYATGGASPLDLNGGLLTAGNATVASGGVLKLGNAAAVGAALVSTHSITVQDSTGTTYRIPVLV